MTHQKIAIGLVAVALFAGVVTAHAADSSEGYKAIQRADYPTALLIFQQLAAQGDAAAQYNLGVMYGNGWGVAQNYEEAMRWYEKAAIQGYVAAQYDLGVIYDNGLGVTQDYVQAHIWYNIAAARGLRIGRRNRDLLAKNMSPEQLAEAQKLAREWKSKKKQ